MNCSASTTIPQGKLDSPCYDKYLRDNINMGNNPWPEVAFMTFAVGSETCVSQLNRLTSTPIPQCKLDSPRCVSGVDINAGNGPWLEVTFMTFTMILRDMSPTPTARHPPPFPEANLAICAMLSISGTMSMQVVAPGQRWPSWSSYGVVEN